MSSALAAPAAIAVGTYLNVIDFGADNSGAADATPAIQAALDKAEAGLRTEGHTVFVPDGVYHLDGTLEVRDYKALLASPGARFVRRAARSKSLAPLIRGSGSYWHIDLGGAWVETENDSPQGVVCLGPADPATQPQGALFWTFRNARLFCKARGYPSSPRYRPRSGIGLYVASAQPFHGSDAANYFGTIENVQVHQATESLLMTDLANGHSVRGLRVEFFYHRAVLLHGAYGNNIELDFINGCYEEDATAIELAPKLAPTARHAATLESSRNRITCPTMELYWKNGTGVTIGKNCQNNFVQFEFSSPGRPMNLVDSHNVVLEGYAQNLPHPVLSNLRTFPDENAAAAAGLASGTVYQTSSGELRVKL